MINLRMFALLAAAASTQFSVFAEGEKKDAEPTAVNKADPNLKQFKGNTKGTEGYSGTTIKCGAPIDGKAGTQRVKAEDGCEKGTAAVPVKK